MKSRITLIFLTSILLVACSDDKKQIDRNWRAYEYAKGNGDYVTAVTALNNIIAIDPFKNNVKDSLARIYFRAQMYKAANSVALELLNNDNAHDEMNLIVAESFNSLGQIEESLTYFDTWLQNNPTDISSRYNYAVNLFNLKKPDEAIPHLKEIIKNPESRKIGKNFGSDASNNQPVSYYGAALNVIGFNELQNNNLREAATLFNECLKSDPHFNLARNNLKALEDLSK
jgi:tetratricopeptide (TPR) repeat protein